MPCVIPVASNSRNNALRNRSKRRGERTEPCTVPVSSCMGAEHPVRDRWYRIFDHRNARPFEEGYGLLLAMDEWLNAYVDPHAAEDMVAWLASISWPGGAITSVHEQMDQVFRMEDTLTMDTANNAPRSRYLARSPDVRLQ